MKVFLFLLSVLCALSCVLCSFPLEPHSLLSRSSSLNASASASAATNKVATPLLNAAPDSLQLMFQTFIHTHKKRYKSAAAQAAAFARFQANHARVHQLNAAHTKAHGRKVHSIINKFADASPEHLIRMLGAQPLSPQDILLSYHRKQAEKKVSSLKTRKAKSLLEQGVQFNPADYSAANFNKKPSTTTQTTKQSTTTYSQTVKSASPTAVSSLPKKVDWRDFVSPQKNQGSCGSCWAFVAVESIEAAYYIKNKPRFGSLYSTQQLIDCDTSVSGCKGGNFVISFDKYLKRSRLALDENYPFQMVDWSADMPMRQQCSSAPAAAPVIQSWDYAIQPCPDSCNEQAAFEGKLLLALQSKGPLAAIVDSRNWHFYTGGVFGPSSCQSTHASGNHAVQIVGYEEGVDGKYWIVRNSWGDDWGESGFIRLQYGTNTCGIANFVAYVTV